MSAASGIIALLAGATEAEARARIAELERARAGGDELVAVVDEPLLARLGAAVAIRPDELAAWLAARPSLRRALVVPRAAALEPEPAPTNPSTAEDSVAWCPPATTPAVSCYVEGPPRALAWHATRGVLEDACRLATPASWDATTPIRAVARSGRSLAWLSPPVANRAARSRVTDGGAPIARGRSVLAVVPYYADDRWLALSIASLTQQTRRPDAIVVVDDASPVSPRPILERFADVTLVRSPARVGMFRLLQQVIEDTRFDAYLFQDADDFSAVDRLERLLDEGERSGAHLIGTQALWFDWDAGTCGLASSPATVPPPSPDSVCSLLHPSSIVSRALLERLGGFATGLHFAGDVELQLRAMLVTTLVSAPCCSYFKIRHSGALTTAPETGIHSTARIELRAALRRRLAGNLAAIASGAPPDLTPFRTAPPVALHRIAGPPLVEAWS